jgi:DNA-binding response OmpR family regulator
VTGDPRAPANTRAEDVRERLRRRVDELLGECNRIADQKRAAEPVLSRPAAVPAIGRANPSPAEPAASEPAPASRRALVIEGNPLHRKVLVRSLEKSGFAVDALDSAEQGLESFQRCPYGIVLVDCDTPEINGFRMAASMRVIEGSARHTPIVGLTGNPSQSHRRERKAAGIDNYLLKPFRRERVDAVVSQYAPTRELRPVPQLLSLDKDRVRELQELACDDPALLDELIDLFLTEAPKLIDQMRRATEDEDGPALRRAAHTLKGSSGQMGALRIQDICATIETLAGTGSLVGVEPLLSEVSLAFARSVGELRSLGNGTLKPVEGRAETGATAERPPRQPAKSNEVLLAEDDMLIARFLVASLSAAGFHVIHVRDGKAALDAVHAKSFAAIVLDINMPELDGYQVLSEIRALVGEGTPVAIISSRHQEQDILRAFDLGVDDYLTKPFNPSEVVARIRRLVRQASNRP